MSSGRIKAFREPRDAQQLFQTIRLALDDLFEFSGSHEVWTWGGQLQCMVGHESCNIVVESLDRGDGFSHVEIREDELAAFRAWREAEKARARNRAGEWFPMCRIDERRCGAKVLCLKDDADVPDLECYVADPLGARAGQDRTGRVGRRPNQMDRRRQPRGVTRRSTRTFMRREIRNLEESDGPAF